MTANPTEFDAYVGCPAREAIECSMLPAYLTSQRWFGGKARRIAAVRIDDWAAFDYSGRRAALALTAVRYADGGDERYFVPVGVASTGDADQSFDPPSASVIGRMETAGGYRVLFDALADPVVCNGLLESVAAGREHHATCGVIRGSATTAFAEARGPMSEPLAIARGAAEQSNSSIVFQPRLIMKVFRRIESGMNPDWELGRFLTERAGFGRVPRTAGAIEYLRPGDEPATLAIMHELVPDATNGWEHALDQLRQYLDRVIAAGSSPPVWTYEYSLEAGRLVGDYPATAALLGRRTAEMHVVLASDLLTNEFRPEPLGAAELAAAVASTSRQLAETLDTLHAAIDRLPDAARRDAALLLNRRDAIAGRLDQLARTPSVAGKIRVHGDYHLGQVLWAAGDFVILDFEGEPARPLAERRAKQSPLKDVAGMLRSFDYAAYAALYAHSAGRPDDLARLEPYARLWQRLTSASFLRAYQSTAGGPEWMPSDGRPFRATLDYFLLDKACYELRYELNNRPNWVRIPLRGILSLLD